MDALLFASNAVAPLLLTAVLGYILKRIGFMTADFAKATNRLVFHVFLPALLFRNIYTIEDLADVEFGFVLYGICGLLVIFFAAIPIAMAVTKKSERRGVLLQAAFRSNYALIGIPLAESLFGAAGAAVATLLSAVMIPMFNVLAVISLSVFHREGEKTSLRKILLGILKNPLIESIVLGLVALLIRALFVRQGIAFRFTDLAPIYAVLGYLANLATPLALLVLGAQFEFSVIGGMRREILVGTLMRTVLVPLLGIGVAYFAFGSWFDGAHFASFVALFATPVAVSSVPMAQEMNSDAALAGQLVVWTTLFSVISLFLASFLLRLAGVF